MKKGKLGKSSKIIAASAKMAKYDKLLKSAQQKCGKYADKEQFCSICQENKLPHNMAVFFHKQDPEMDKHIFCCKCIHAAMQAADVNLMENSGQCPYCRRDGHPIKLYHAY